MIRRFESCPFPIVKRNYVRLMKNNRSLISRLVDSLLGKVRCSLRRGRWFDSTSANSKKIKDLLFIEQVLTLIITKIIFMTFCS